MASVRKKYVVTAIAANSATLTPWVGTNSSGPVSGTLPTGDQDIQGGLSSVVFNFTGTPDSQVFHRVGAEVFVYLETQGA